MGDDLARFISDIPGTIWGPEDFHVAVVMNGRIILSTRCGNAVIERNPEWGDEHYDFRQLATEKALKADEYKCSTLELAATSSIVTLPFGTVMHAGGVYGYGLAIGVSGAKDETDHGYAMMLLEFVHMRALNKSRELREAAEKEGKVLYL